LAIAIIVEDGTNVIGANSWVSVDDYISYAASRGVTVTGDADVLASQLLQAVDYINTYRDRFKGAKTYITQTMQWPRQYVTIDNADWPKDVIPPELIAAQCQLGMALFAGITFNANVAAGLPVIMEKVDVIETQYASPSAVAGFSWQEASLPVVDGLLAPLLRGSAMFLRNIRY
jgi:hypothetical protein